ncbi:NAD-dependent epimerase/dehydratase family protein [Oceaniglobus trochenteri]|uniref:NAD-dependent epimerase/dehydratase family protein n=1 Tax=Oceaniglobus trochenteri TaxID=2763260 RepID=UPI001CFFDB7E|nr:NAD(P)-dependent oxidoreductase [Oceaniglobus trochenteri]
MDQRILVTGAAGRVAVMLRPLLLQRYGRLVLSDRTEPADLAEGEVFRQADLGDVDAIRRACDGVTGVIHLGGRPNDGTWAEVAAPNIEGVMNLFEGARRAGVERVVFASSNHAIGMYPRHRRIGTKEPVRPDGHYGLSKVFGEAVAALYADKHGMRCLSIRIGNVAPKPLDLRRLSVWLHPEDLLQLCAIGLEHPKLHHAVVFGVSDNVRTFWDNQEAFQLGYRPAHRAEDHRAHALTAQGEVAAETLADRFQGGAFAGNGFDGDAERTLWS